MKYDFDVIVIGSGSGGLTVSIGLSRAGKKVALVERGLIGGDCTNYGCIPSKALIDVAKSSKCGAVKCALEEVRLRRKVVQDEETPEKIEKYGIKVFQGFASLKDKNTILIDEKEEITAKYIVLSTGSRANKIDIPGLDKKYILTNKEVFELQEDIKDLIIIGGGYIGCELAEAFSALGVKVTILQRNNRLIPGEEREASELLKNIFEEKGIDIQVSMIIEMVEKNQLIVHDRGGNNKRKIKFDKILFAVGRQANIEGLGLEELGIKADSRGIIVDKYNRTSEKNIFAIGDCVLGNPQFTHMANAQGRAVIQNILIPFFKISVKNTVLPTTLYTEYEVAKIGKTYDELLQSYDREEIISKIIYFEDNDRSKVTKDTQGFVKINFKRLTGKILGATIMGKNAGEMLPVLTLAMQNNVSAYRLSKQIFAYPTKAELIKKVADIFVLQTLGNLKGEIKFYLKENILQISTFIIWGIILFSFFSLKFRLDLSFEQMALEIYNFIAGTMYGPLIYILFYAIRPVVLFPATLMTFIAGALFGFVGGFIFTMIGENLSAIFAYFLGSIFGKKVIKNGDTGSFLHTLKLKVNKDPFINVLVARFLFFPFDLTNYACGFLRVRFRSFVGATILGIIPGASVFILAGAAFYNDKLTSLSDTIKDINVTMLYYAAGLFVFTLLFAKLLRKTRPGINGKK